MNYLFLKNWIASNLILNSRLRSNVEKRITLEMKKELLIATSFLDSLSSIRERIYCVINNIHENKKCLNEDCFNLVSFNSFCKGYFQYCSNKCVGKSKIVRENTRKTFMKKYGCDSSFKSEKVKEKIKETNLRRYGKKCAAKSDIVKKKITNSHISKYGLKRASMLKKIKDKTKKTNIKKYGTEWSSQNEEIKNKRRKTCIEKYGFDSPVKNEQVLEKIKKTNLKRYGKEFVVDTEHFKNSHSRSHFDDKIISKINDSKWLKKEHHKKNKTCSRIAEEIGLSPSFVRNKMISQGIEIRNFSFSMAEKEITDFLKIENLKTNVRNIIPPYELDIYIPEHKLAIEFDGLFWHSSHDEESDKVKKNYHLNKTSLCQKKGIKLFHIFENEWLDTMKKDIWKSIINKYLNKTEIINNKEFLIKECSKEQYSNFLYENHLCNKDDSRVNLGMFYNEELLLLMTINEDVVHFYENKNITINYDFLFKYYVDKYKPEKLKTFLDRRFENEKSYQKLGFKLKYNSEPNSHSFKLNKKILCSSGEFCDGYNKIWDCGNAVYVWKNN